MGRGGSKNQALHDARGLLFGPRRGRKLAPEVKQKMVRKEAARRRSEAMQKDKDSYIKALEEGSEKVIAGEGGDLAATLRVPAKHGLKGIEKKFVKETINSIYGNYFYVLPRRKSDDEIKPFNNPDDVEAIMLLHDRARERNLSDNDQWQSRLLARRYCEIAGNQALAEQLKQEAVNIGPLPRIIDGGDFQSHLLGKDGNSLCGKTDQMRYDPHRVDQFDHTPASSNLECPDCLAAYKNSQKDAVVLTPAEWAALLDTVNHDNWTANNDNAFAPTVTDIDDSSSDASERARKLNSEFEDRARQTANEDLAQFTNYHLS